jgi:Phospholipid methyltransferase
VERDPYGLMRHPIYTGHLLMGLGTAIASGSLAAFAGLASFVGGFWIDLNQEERLLLRGFPDEYPAYKVRVKADSLCVLTCEARTIGNITSAHISPFYPPIVWGVGKRETDDPFR